MSIDVQQPVCHPEYSPVLYLQYPLMCCVRVVLVLSLQKQQLADPCEVTAVLVAQGPVVDPISWLDDGEMSVGETAAVPSVREVSGQHRKLLRWEQ